MFPLLFSVNSQSLTGLVILSDTILIFLLNYILPNFTISSTLYSQTGLSFNLQGGICRLTLLSSYLYPKFVCRPSHLTDAANLILRTDFLRYCGAELFLVLTVIDLAADACDSTSFPLSSRQWNNYSRKLCRSSYIFAMRY
jgi:hypothetical protein